MESRAVRILLWIAIAVPLLMVAVYISLVRGQGSSSPDVYTVPFVAAFMLLLAAMLGVSLMAPVPAVARSTLRGAAAGGLIVLGVIAGFSIGPPILIAGLLAAVAFSLSIPRSHIAASLVAGGVAAVLCGLVFLLGIDVANRTIVCPAGADEGGGGNGILLGPYSYQCSGGELHWNPTPGP